MYVCMYVSVMMSRLAYTDRCFCFLFRIRLSILTNVWVMLQHPSLGALHEHPSTPNSPLNPELVCRHLFGPTRLGFIAVTPPLLLNFAASRQQSTNIPPNKFIIVYFIIHTSGSQLKSAKFDSRGTCVSSI